ncbi:hypothetical protein MMC18_006552 [Xylographa bjoerkii]|nr:hypothetical protein [Xylographa bjoerkii]
MATTIIGVPDPDLNFLAEQLHQGRAILSTNRGKYPPRRAQPRSTPVILRSDCEADLVSMIAELRVKFPQECKKITLPVNNIYEYFDHYDVNIQGSAFIVRLLDQIAKENEKNTKTAQDFATRWMGSHSEGFPDIDLDNEDLFSTEEKEHYNYNFLKDVLELLKSFQAGSAASSEQTIERGRLAVPSSIRQESPASSSFESNPSNYRRAASASRERSSFLAPPLVLEASLMTDRAYTRRRNSARHTSAEQRLAIVPPVQYHSDTDAEAGVDLRDRLPLPSEPQLQSLHMHHSVRSASDNIAGAAHMRYAYPNRSNFASGVVEPFPLYFQPHNLGNMNAGSSRTIGRHSRGQPFGQKGGPRRSHYNNNNSQPSWSYHAVNQYTSSPTLRVSSNSNMASDGHNRRYRSGSHGAHAVYNPDAAFPSSSNDSSMRPSPVLGGQALPYMPMAVPQTAPGFLAENQSYTYHGYIENMHHSSSQGLHEPAPSPLPMPRVRNSHQNRTSQNVPNQFSQQHQPSARHEDYQNHGELQGQAQSQALPRNNPRKSFSDDARTMQMGDINSRRSSVSEHHSSRRESSSELYGSTRDQGNIQQQPRRMSGARNGSRHSSFSQSNLPFRDQYKRSVQGAYGGYSPMGYFSAGRGSGDYSHLVHQTIEEHRSDGDRHSLINHNEVPGNENDMREVGRFGEAVSDIPNAPYRQQQGLTPVEQVPHMEMTSGYNRSLSTMQSHQSSQPSNNTSDTQPLPAIVTTLSPQDSRARYNRYQPSERPLDPLKLFISASTESADEIHHAFRPYGNIQEITGPFTKPPMKQYINRPPLPYYFLTYSQPAEAITAVERLDQTPLPSRAGFMKVSFAFLRPGDIREVQEVTSSADSATRSAHPRNTQLLDASNSQTTPRVQLTAENTQSASQSSVSQVSGPQHTQTDMTTTIIRQNVRNTSNLSNPSTPKKKKNNKKPKNPPSNRKEGASSVNLRPRVAKSVSQMPHAPESRPEVKQLHKGDVGAHERAAMFDKAVPNSRSIAEASSKEIDNKQEGDVTENASEIIPASAEDLNIAVSHRHDLPRRNDSHITREQLNILDGSPSRKPRNLSSSRNASQPQPQSSPTEASGQVISGNLVAPDLSEDQWPALQRPSPSPKKGQRGSMIPKRLNYRAISLKTASEFKTEVVSKTATKKKDANDPEEGPSNAASNVSPPVTVRAKSSDLSVDLKETLRNTRAEHNSECVKSQNVTFPSDIHIKVPTTPDSVEASREVASAGGYITTNPPSYSQTERSNSWVEELGSHDISVPGKSDNRTSTTTKQNSSMMSAVVQTRHTSSTSEMHETDNGFLLAQPSKQEDRALSSDVTIKLEMAPPSGGSGHDTALTPIPTVDVEPPLSKSYDGNHEIKDMSAIISSDVSSVEDSITTTKISSRAKGKQKVLTIQVPPRTPQLVSAISVAPPLSKSPKSSKPMQRIEAPISTSSQPDPAPAISTHMKKKTKKITPPRKTSRTSAPTKKDTKVDKSPANGTIVGSSKDVTSSDPTLEQEKVANTQDLKKSKSEGANAPTVDLADDPGPGKEVSDDIQQDENSPIETAQTDGQVPQIRSYPATDPSNAVYVSEVRGPSVPKRQPLDLVHPESDFQLVQGRSYPAPNPSCAVYVAGRLPTKMLVLECSNQVKDEKIAATPPSSPDMTSKKERVKVKKAKKRKSKEISEHQNISASEAILPFPKPKAQTVAFPTLPLDEPSPTNSSLQEDSKVEAEMSDPFAVLDPLLQVEHVGHRERSNTGVWINAVNEKRQEAKALMTLKNMEKSPDIEAFDVKGQGYRKRKAPLRSELLQHIDHMGAHGLGLTVRTTSQDRDSPSMESTKQDMTGKMLSTRSSINDMGFVPDLTRGSSIVSSSSNIIFPDVPGYMPKTLSTILAPVNLTHDPSFNSRNLETSNLKARPPPHRPEFDSDIFDRPAVRMESPPKSPLAPDFGSGSISADFKPDIEQGAIGLEAFTPVPSPVKPIFSLDLLEISSTVLEAPLKKMKLSGGAGSSSVASGFEHKSPIESKASDKELDQARSDDAVPDVQSLLSARPDIILQLSDDLNSAAEAAPPRKIQASKGVETQRKVQIENEVRPSGLVNTRIVVSGTGHMFSVEADNKPQSLENLESLEEKDTGKEIHSSDEAKPLEAVNQEDGMKPKDEVKTEDETTSQIVSPSNTVVDGDDTVSAESGSLIPEPSKVVERLSTSADIEDPPSAEQTSPTKAADGVEPFSAVSEASTIKAMFPSLRSDSFSTIPDSPPKLSEANVAAHTVATDSDEAREIGRSRNESISEWSTTSSFRRKTYSEAAVVPSPAPRTRGQSMMSPAESEAEVDVKRRIKPRRGETSLWSIPPKEQRWTSAEE